MQQQRAELVLARERIEEQVMQRLEAKRSQVAAAEAKKAREESSRTGSDRFAAIRQQLAESEQLLKAREFNERALNFVLDLMLTGVYPASAAFT